jgi:hypothetical protein
MHHTREAAHPASISGSKKDDKKSLGERASERDLSQVFLPDQKKKKSSSRGTLLSFHSGTERKEEEAEKETKDKGQLNNKTIKISNSRRNTA